VALVAERLFLFNHQGTPLAAWAPAQTRCHAGPTAAGKNSFFVGCDDGRVYRVKRTGPLHGSKKGRFKVTWSAQCATAPIRSTLAVGVAQTVFAVSADQHVCALSPRMNHKHALLWKVKLPHPITTAPSVGSRGRVVVATDGGTVVCLSAFGKKLWQHRTNGGESIVSRPLFDANGYVYFGGRDGYLRCLSPHGRLVWKRSGGADIDSGPALAPHRTLVVATDRFTLLGLTR
jgi:outer membrane protein assembly factor BamB